MRSGRINGRTEAAAGAVRWCAPADAPTSGCLQGGHARERGGFVVFGMLLAIVGTLTAAVLIGIALERARRGPPPTPVPRELRYAARPLEVRFGALTAARIPEGGAVWVGAPVDGRVVVFQGEESNRIIGYVLDVDLMADAPPRASPGLLRSSR
jgi:hypothetical protein